MDYRLILGDMFSFPYPSPPKNQTTKPQEINPQNNCTKNLDFIPVRNARKNQNAQKMLWDANSQPHFVEEEIEAGERSSFARAAVQTPDRRRVKKTRSFTNTRSTGLIFLGNVFTLSQPSVAQRLSSRNVVGVPLGMGQQRDAGLPSNGDWGQTQYWRPSSSCARWQE